MGKSSLAFDTIYAEGQRRFVEPCPPIRQFLERTMERPDVDHIEGSLPALAIEQKNSVKNARSTVGTATELADYMRLFMTYCGETFCPDCAVPIRRESAQSVAAEVITSLDSSRILVLAPLFIAEENRSVVVPQLIKGGFYRIWLNNSVVDLKEVTLPGVTSFEIVLGRYRVRSESSAEITEAIEQAIALSGGVVNVLQESGEQWLSHRYSAAFACNQCGREFTEPTPHLFSFNSPLGACTECQGYGRVIGIDMDKVIPVRSQRLDELPIAPWNSPGYQDTYEDLEKAARKYKLRLDVPIEELTPEEWEILYTGRGKWYGIKGFFEWLETKKYRSRSREARQVPLLYDVRGVPRNTAEGGGTGCALRRAHHR